MREVPRALDAARETLALGHFVVAIQQAQICVEYCARAVIHSYGEPAWGHSDAEDLEKALLHHGSDLRRRFGRETLRALQQFAADDREMAPWHSRTVYGMRYQDGTFHPPSEMCTQAIAERALLLAERSLTAAQGFLDAWHAAAP